MIAKNNYGSVSCTCNLTVDRGLHAYISPQFQKELEPAFVEVEISKELRLACKVQAYPAVGVTWYKNGVTIL